MSILPIHQPFLFGPMKNKRDTILKYIQPITSMRIFYKKSWFLLLVLVVIQAVAIAQNPSDVDVSKLSDQQIQQALMEMQKRGLTMEQAAALARARGATPAQISQFQQRALTLQAGGSQTGATSSISPQPGGSSMNMAALQQFALSPKAVVEVSEKAKKIFGYTLFNSNNLSFEPAINIPVPNDYVLGINDELQINIWGASQQTYRLLVDANGSIQIPDLGPVFVSGLNFEQAQQRIKNRLVEIYSGMSGDNPNTFAAVSISNLRSIKVNVVGEVNAPGTYTLPATASAFNALYLSGGPNENGSFRKIKVIRQNKEIAEIDVYDFLLHANTADNVVLREQDMLFIPTYSKRVAAFGAFKREGYYELLENETLEDLIDYSGGFSDRAFQERLTITRTTGKQLKVLDITQDEFQSFLPFNGDSIVAGKIIGRFENRVSIRGAVFRPGTYALTDGLKLSELIRKAEGLKENVFENRGLIIRKGKDLSPTTIPFDVTEILNGQTDIALKREDQVIIRDIFSMREKRFVRIFGEVQKPGEYSFQEDMTLKDLIFQAGGFTEAASESVIELARRHDYQAAAEVSDELGSLHQFTIDRSLKLQTDDAQFSLKPYDYIYVRQAPSYKTQRTVNIRGEIVYPGPYSIGKKTERISDLIARAGGLTPQAYIKGAILKRKNQHRAVVKESLNSAVDDSLLGKAEKQLEGYSKLELRLDDILKNPGSIYDYMLREGDQIIIPEAVQEIMVSGEVLNPMGLAYQPNRSLRYYIERSGGFSPNAKKGKVFIIYSDGTTKITKGVFNRDFPAPEPGCQIIVPSKPERPGGDQTSKWLAIAGTFSSIAVAIAAVFR